MTDLNRQNRKPSQRSYAGLVRGMDIQWSDEPVKLPVKMLLYGGPGTGKTVFALKAENAFYIDTEGGTDPYRAQDDFPRMPIHKTADIYEVITILEVLKATGEVPLPDGTKYQPDTIIIDAATVFYHTLQDTYYTQPGNLSAEKALTADSWNKIKRVFNRFYNLLIQVPVNVILIAREKDETKNQSGTLVNTGNKIAEMEKSASYIFHFALRLEVAPNGQRIGHVIKSRYKQYSTGSKLTNPDWNTIAQLATTEGAQAGLKVDPTEVAKANADKPTPAGWTQNAQQITKAEGWLAELGLTDIEADAAVGGSWRETHLEGEAFKATINAYIEEQIAASEEPAPETETEPAEASVEEPAPEAEADPEPEAEIPAVFDASSDEEPEPEDKPKKTRRTKRQPLPEEPADQAA